MYYLHQPYHNDITHLMTTMVKFRALLPEPPREPKQKEEHSPPDGETQLFAFLFS
jgi:hypothetical protein